ncbi:asparagine synthase (glutamine-hydrolyzing) [Paraburkholderia sp. SARCC-3016]|uniref:asparagine synthase (glutamine-hydrolyzing) n=1 Tax=Paraburkholderia sp. SARCC-3016 TaxID=3058611 RepID=UPI002807FD88|nr:asparagine synthase (glutamine-hydrolyzing) [Paraburkholderia sp. SARCC-3016]MDQ7977994.1 asparagine synthase (glutamine-hydrolyzing) [Paraburkholderia sp. SARCC-3016]
MCGIAGWVDYDRDLNGERRVIQTMTDTLALRGPDAQGIWIGTHAALGHRRLSVIDLEGGAQPMCAIEDGKTIACLTYSGEVYNFVALREMLQKRGHTFRTKSDTEVVLRAYLEWGEACAERFVGMFAFAIWDVREARLLLVRDRLGVKPLFYRPFGRGVLFGSEPKAILAHPQMRPRVGLDGLRRALSVTRLPGDAIYDGMHEVKPGHIVRVSRDELTEHCYWKLEAREHTDSLERTIETVRAHLERIVEQQTVSDVPLCSLLSGGLDSSAVTALADRLVRQRDGHAVRTYSVDFADRGVPFGADHSRDSRDAPFVRAFVEQLRTQHTEIELGTAQIARPEVRRAVVDAYDANWKIGSDMCPSLYLLFSAVRRDSTVALSGEAADEVFGGYRWHHLPQFLDPTTLPWKSGLADPARVLTRELRDALHVPEYWADTHDQVCRATPALPGEGALARRRRELAFLGLTCWLPNLLDRKDRLSMAVGLEVRVPYCDHELVQYMFNVPWEMKSFDGREKSLLRAASKDVLPDAILNRKKSAYPATQDPAYERMLQQRMAALLANPSLRVQQLFDRDAMRSLIDKPVGESSINWERVDVDHTLALADWLERYDVEIVSA